VHFEQGREYKKAVQYLQQAVEKAIQRRGYREAIDLLNKGFALLKTLPGTPERNQQELALQVTLGASLLVTKGYTAPEVERVYTRALELCQQVGETPWFFWVLVGLVNTHLMQGRPQAAHEIGEQLLALAQKEQKLGASRVGSWHVRDRINASWRTNPRPSPPRTGNRPLRLSHARSFDRSGMLYLFSL
jgi:predicted ATPase